MLHIMLPLYVTPATNLELGVGAKLIPEVSTLAKLNLLHRNRGAKPSPAPKTCTLT